MSYKVLTAFSVHDLEFQVKAAMAEGWAPQGGISISFGHQVSVGRLTMETHFAQAMVLPAAGVIAARKK